MNFKLAVVFVCLVQMGWSQTEPYAKEIKAFQKEDSAQAPPVHPILFVGSSSFTYWNNLKESFSGFTVLNRAFGGSTLLDQLHYFDQVISKYEAKQIVIYCGENDLAYNDTLSAATMVSRFKKLFEMIRERNPKIPITYVSLKPSPSRIKWKERYETGNKLIKEFLQQQKKTSFVDVYSLMMQNGKPLKEIFLQDSLHMNSKGYEIWKKAIRPHLKK